MTKTWKQKTLERKKHLKLMKNPHPAALGRRGESAACRQAVPAGKGWAASKGMLLASTDAGPGWETVEGKSSFGGVRESNFRIYGPIPSLAATPEGPHTSVP